MRWQDLDLGNGIWMVPVDWSKNERELGLALTDVAVAILQRRLIDRGSSPWVWPAAKAGSGHVEQPRYALRRFLKAAGIEEHAHLHDVRRTLGSNLGKSGASPAIISKALGHRSAASAKPYVHLDVEPARAAIDKALTGLIDAT
jgi:integrase